LTNREIQPLTRADLILALRQKVALSANEASEIIEDTLEVVSQILQNEGQFIVSSLGRFYVKPTPARLGRNPKTGISATVPAKLRPTFSMNRHLRAQMLDKWPQEPQATPAADDRDEEKI
jgi:integration host factor subunit alpha